MSDLSLTDVVVLVLVYELVTWPIRALASYTYRRARLLVIGGGH